MRGNQLLGICVVRRRRAWSPRAGVFTPGLQFDDVEKRVLRLAVDLSAQLHELRGRQASNSFYRLRRSRRSQSAVREHAAARLSSIRRADAGISDRDRLRSTPRLQTGKRASEAFASTSIPAFELSRISSDVLSRVTEAAANQLLVDAPAKGYRSESDFPACVAGGRGPIYARPRSQSKARAMR